MNYGNGLNLLHTRQGVGMDRVLKGYLTSIEGEWLKQLHYALNTFPSS